MKDLLLKGSLVIAPMVVAKSRTEQAPRFDPIG